MGDLIVDDIIVVTGASRGIGADIVRSLFRHHPHRIFLTSRRQDALDRIVSDLADQNPDGRDQGVTPSGRMEGRVEGRSDGRPDSRCIAFAADLSAPDGIGSIADAVRAVLEATPGSRLAGIINNAGFLTAKPFLELTEEDWDLHYRINLRAPASLIRELAPFLASHAHIVNISSMGGFQGSSKFTGLSAYSATKGGLSILSECLAQELGDAYPDRSISCNALCLGAVQTEMLEEAFPGFKAPVSAADMGRWIAEFAIHGGRLFNGQVLPVTLADPVR